jgi:uncharacterized membrane protein
VNCANSRERRRHRDFPCQAARASNVGSIALFAISPALQSQSWRTALVLGLLLGLLAYGTYDMTNLATLRRWPVALALVDMTWGSLLTGRAATAGYRAVRLSAAAD